jgi:SPP1 family predicted phage head-tail adaptor
MSGLKAGELDRLIVIQAQTVQQNAIGEPIKTWTTVATVWAKALPMYATERFTAAEVHSFKTVRFTIRPLRSIRETMRIIFENTFYKITGVAEIGRGEGMQITGEAVDHIGNDISGRAQIEITAEATA